MATRRTDRFARTKIDRERGRGPADAVALRDRASVHNIATLLLAGAVLLALGAALATVRLTYRPYRGC